MTSPDWLNQALDAHLASRPTRVGDMAVSADFSERCRNSALAALDVLKMRQQLSSVSQRPGSLLDLFGMLATQASVGLERVLRGFGIQPTEPPNVASARGLARLAWQLGLSRAESTLRLRWGFAKTLTPTLMPVWPSDPLPVRARRASPNSPTTTASNHDDILRQCESRYTDEQRHDLNDAMTAFTAVFESVAE